MPVPGGTEPLSGPQGSFLSAGVPMPDLLAVAGALHRELHAGEEPLHLARCPFHDADVITLRAQRLLPWYAVDAGERS